MPETVAQIWKRIHKVVDNRWPRTAGSFNPPATTSEIQDLEAAVGIVLPADFRQSLEIHNGQQDSHSLLGLSLDGSLMTTDAIRKAWEMITSVDLEFRGTDPNWNSIVWWNPKWIPFADNRSGDYLCINTDPDSLPLGQTVYHVHDNPCQRAKWRDFSSWLEEIAWKLERNQIAESDGSVRIRHDEEIQDSPKTGSHKS